MGTHARQRPAVSVVVPFLGSPDEAAEAVRQARGDRAPRRRRGDPRRQLTRGGRGRARRVGAGSGSSPPRSSARPTRPATRAPSWPRATGCSSSTPIAGRARPLLDDYFSRPIDEACGAVAGEVLGAPEQQALAARYARSRAFLSLANSRGHPYLPIAPTANLLVRRSAWARARGIPGGDVGRRRRLVLLAPPGSRLASLPARGGGRRAPSPRHAAGPCPPGGSQRGRRRMAQPPPAGGAASSPADPRPRPVDRRRGALRRAGAARAGEVEAGRRGGRRLAVGRVADEQRAGRRRAARAWRPSSWWRTRSRDHGSASLAQLRELYDVNRLRVEAAARAEDADWATVRGLETRFWEDEGAARRAIDTAWLCLRHPLRSLADRRRSASGGRSPGRAAAPRAGAGCATAGSRQRRSGRARGWKRPEAGGAPVAPQRRRSEHEGPVADRPADDGGQLDQVVQDEVRQERHGERPCPPAWPRFRRSAV